MKEGAKRCKSIIIQKRLRDLVEIEFTDKPMPPYGALEPRRRLD